MNEGEIHLTSLQKAQQDRGREKMAMYWKNAAPALGASLQSLKDEGVLQEQAGGASDQTGRVVANEQGKAVAARSYDTGAAPGSGAFAARQGGIAMHGAGAGGQMDASARSNVTGQMMNKRAAIVNAGQGVVQRSDQALDVAAKIQAGLYQKAVQNRTEDEAAFAEAGQQLESMSGSMGGSGGGMGGGGGGMGGMGGGGGGG